MSLSKYTPHMSLQIDNISGIKVGDMVEIMDDSEYCWGGDCDISLNGMTGEVVKIFKNKNPAASKVLQLKMKLPDGQEKMILIFSDVVNLKHVKIGASQNRYASSHKTAATLYLVEH